MSGPDDVSVVWLGAAGAPVVTESTPGDGGRRDDARRALDSWARARGLTLVAPAEPTPGIDASDTMARAERELDRAREAIAALDADAAERALARAEQQLRAHPELPGAAWLRAEVLRAWSSRWERVEPRDPALAREAWQEASALDGGRSAGVGEVAHPARARAKARFAVHGAAGGRVVLRLDGRPLATTTAGDALVAEVEIAPAEHQVVVQIDERPAAAAWVAIGAGAPAVVDLVVSEGALCSRDAFASATRDGDRVRGPGVACPRWVAAVAGPRPGSVLVARCALEDCGPLLEWHSERLPAAPPPATARASWPGWATWVLVGVGAAAAGTVGLVAAGAFESRAPEARFVAGGVRNE